jgi:drug/metabolite transporter (DMT)-like permease
VLATRRPLPPDPFATTVVEMAAGGATMVALGSIGGEWGRLDLGAVHASAWLAFGYLVVVGSAVAYSAYVWLLARAPVSLVTTYAYVNPAVAVALGALFLDEPLSHAGARRRRGDHRRGRRGHQHRGAQPAPPAAAPDLTLSYPRGRIAG